jgi:hypothetical protein
MKYLPIVWGVGMAAVACGVTRLDAGSTDAGTRDAGEDQGALWPRPPSNDLELECSLPAPDFAAGVWKGRFDSYAPPSGPDIEIDVKGSYKSKNGLCGTVTFGTGDLVPLPEDPSAAPPDAPKLPLPIEFTPTAGFAYQFFSYGSTFDGGVASVATVGRRLRFSVNLTQVYKAWCNMQRSYLESTPPDVQKILEDPTKQLIGADVGTYGCLPPHSFSVSTDGVVCDGLNGLTVQKLSCEQAGYCLFGLCSCGNPGPGLDGLTVANTGCTASEHDARFDVTVSDDGTTMTGSYVLPSRVETLHLTRPSDAGL